MKLISYGSVSTNFSFMAGLSKLVTEIKFGDVKETRRDCYDAPQLLSSFQLRELTNKFREESLPEIKSLEIFYPKISYPPHVDGEGISYFIGMEEGNFTIGGVIYRIVPFVLYSFDDRELHNSDFMSIMLK